MKILVIFILNFYNSGHLKKPKKITSFSHFVIGISLFNWEKFGQKETKAV
jgi:hypothetical protein